MVLPVHHSHRGRGLRTSHPTTGPWGQGPHTRWVIAKEILIYEQQNLLTPSLSVGETCFLWRAAGAGAALSWKPS